MSPYLFLALRILIAVTLYAFLLTILLYLWRDIHHGFRRKPSGEIRVIHLRFEDRHPAEEHSFAIPSVIIGSDPLSELVLSSETVSDHHARLHYRQDKWWVEDLDSKNGTYLNNMMISTPTAIMDGDRLRCGDIQFRITFGRESDPGIAPLSDSQSS